MYRKKPMSKGCLLHHSNRTFWKRQVYGDSKRIIGECGGVGRRMKRFSTEDFKAVRTTPHDAMMLDACQHPSVQTHGVYDTKREP